MTLIQFTPFNRCSRLLAISAFTCTDEERQCLESMAQPTKASFLMPEDLGESLVYSGVSRQSLIPPGVQSKKKF